MPTLTLFAKAHNKFRPDRFDNSLKNTLEGLRVQTKTCGATERGWIQVSISGEDTNVASNYLDKKIGLCPVDLENIHRFSTVKGRIMDLKEGGNEIQVDIGVFSPRIYDARIPLSSLRGQLADGRDISLKRIADLFGLCKELPFTVKIDAIDVENGFVEAEIAEAQRRQYSEWAKSLLDRLIVIGSSLWEIESAIETTGSKRDVVKVESIGGFEFAVVCKLGTDAVGLIPKIGKILRNASFVVNSPRRILGFFGDDLSFLIS